MSTGSSLVTVMCVVGLGGCRYFAIEPMLVNYHDEMEVLGYTSK